MAETTERDAGALVDAPYRRLSPLRSGQVHWTRGFWADRLKQTHAVTLPEMRTALDDLDNGAVFSNFYSTQIQLDPATGATVASPI